jgi:DNA-binding transcriptional regulator YiaG
MLSSNTDGFTTYGSDQPLSNNACYPGRSIEEFGMKEFRLEKGMTQVEFAKFYEIELATLKRWENKKNDMTFNAKVKKIVSDWQNLAFGNFGLVKHQ